MHAGWDFVLHSNPIPKSGTELIKANRRKLIQTDVENSFPA